MTVIAVVAAMILIAGSTHRAGAQSSQSSTTQKDLVDMQKKFQDLTVAGDSAGVSALMSDEAIFIHGNGAAQSKAEILDGDVHRPTGFFRIRVEGSQGRHI